MKKQVLEEKKTSIKINKKIIIIISSCILALALIIGVGALAFSFIGSENPIIFNDSKAKIGTLDDFKMDLVFTEYQNATENSSGSLVFSSTLSDFENTVTKIEIWFELHSKYKDCGTSSPSYEIEYWDLHTDNSVITTEHKVRFTEQFPLKSGFFTSEYPYLYAKVVYEVFINDVFGGGKFVERTVYLKYDFYNQMFTA